MLTRDIVQKLKALRQNPEESESGHFISHICQLAKRFAQEKEDKKRLNNKEEFKRAIKEMGVSIDVTAGINTPLKQLIAENNLEADEAADFLLECGANINTAVESYAKRGDVNQVKKLLRKGASLNSVVGGYAKGGKTAEIEYLLKQGATDVSVSFHLALEGWFDEVENWIDPHPEHALLGYVLGRHFDQVIHLLNKGIVLPLKPIIVGLAKMGCIDEVEMLFTYLNINHFTRVETQDHPDILLDALEAAVFGFAWGGHFTQVQKLLKYKYVFILKTAIAGFAQGGHVEKVKKWLSECTTNGYLYLLENMAVSGFASGGNVEAVEEFVQKYSQHSNKEEQKKRHNLLLSAIKHYAKWEHFIPLKALLTKQPSHWFKNQAIHLLAKVGAYEKVRDLMAENKQNVDLYKTMCKNALDGLIAGEHFLLLGNLLDQYPGLLEEGVKTLAQYGEVDQIERLFKRYSKDYLSRKNDLLLAVVSELVEAGLLSGEQTALRLLCTREDDLRHLIVTRGYELEADRLIKKMKEEEERGAELLNLPALLPKAQKILRGLDLGLNYNQSYVWTMESDFRTWFLVCYGLVKQKNIFPEFIINIACYLAPISPWEVKNLENNLNEKGLIRMEGRGRLRRDTYFDLKDRRLSIRRRILKKYDDEEKSIESNQLDSPYSPCESWLNLPNPSIIKGVQILKLNSGDTSIMMSFKTQKMRIYPHFFTVIAPPQIDQTEENIKKFKDQLKRAGVSLSKMQVVPIGYGLFEFVFKPDEAELAEAVIKLIQQASCLPKTEKTLMLKHALSSHPVHQYQSSHKK